MKNYKQHCSMKNNFEIIAKIKYKTNFLPLLFSMICVDSVKDNEKENSEANLPL